MSSYAKTTPESQRINPINHTIMEEIFGVLFALGEVVLYAYLFIAMCSIFLSTFTPQTYATDINKESNLLVALFHITKNISIIVLMR